jgi:hypothetical protein
MFPVGNIRWSVTVSDIKIDTLHLPDNQGEAGNGSGDFDYLVP